MANEFPPNGVSVIVPVYNREKYLKECLDSILAQDYDGPLEIIVCDDGSTDKTLEIADSYGPPIVVLRKPEGCKDQGPAPTRNRGIAASQYPFIAFLDSDDLFLPGHLERLAGVLLHETGAMLVFDEAMYCLRDGTKCDFPYPDQLKNDPCAPIMLLEPLPPTNAMMFRRSVLQEIGEPFDTSLRYAEDNDFRLRIAEKYPVRFVTGYGSMIREHEERSIRTKQINIPYENDMRMVKMATARYRYPLWVVRFRKAKIRHALAMHHWRQGKRFRAFAGLLHASLTAPELVLLTIYRWLQRKKVL